MSPRILVIDDSQDIRVLLKCIIWKNFKLHSITSQSGNEAIALIKRESFDLIICDIQMPNGSGLDVYYFLSEYHPEMLDKLIFFTANSDILKILPSCVRAEKPNFNALLKFISKKLNRVSV